MSVAERAIEGLKRFRNELRTGKQHFTSHVLAPCNQCGTIKRVGELCTNCRPSTQDTPP